MASVVTVAYYIEQLCRSRNTCSRNTDCRCWTG